MKNIKKILEQYKNYIFIVSIIILIIIVGIVYSNSVTNKYEEKIKEIKPQKEEKKELKKLFVDIKGEVNNPGVYELNNSERVIDVIKKANGLTESADTSYINLSKKIKDEMVIIIYSKDEIKEYEKELKENNTKEIIKYEVVEKQLPCPNTTNESCVNNKNTDKTKEKNDNTDNKKNEDNIQEDTLINLNTASKEQLLTLPGIGESKADLILEYQKGNKFTSIEDIKNVKGIGDSLFEKIKDHITV